MESMAENLKLARLYLLLLALFTVGRWLSGTFHVPYEKGTHVFSVVTLTGYAAVFYCAFCRRWRGFRLWRGGGAGPAPRRLRPAPRVAGTPASSPPRVASPI